MSQTKELNTVRYNLTYDEIFKGSFSYPDTATKLVNVILNENIDEKDVTITSSELFGESIEMKTSLFDVRLKVADIYDIDLEMQKYKPYSYSLIDRLVYYLGKMISLSVKEGETYQGKICISIIFINFPLEGYNNCVNEVTFKNDNNIAVSKHKIILIDLTKKDKCDKVELSKWIRLITSTDVLSFKGEDKIMDKVIEKVLDMNADDFVQARLMSREKYIRDHMSNEVWKKKQLEEASKQGLKQGLEQGIKQSKLEIAKNMKDMGLDVEVISKATSLSVEEINKL